MAFGPPSSSPPPKPQGGDASPARPDWDELARYAAGETDASESARVSAWLETHPADHALVEALAQPITDTVAGTVDVEAALARVHGLMQNTRRAADVGHRRPILAPAAHRPGLLRAPATRPRRWRAATAASLLAAAAVVLLIFTRHRRPPSGGQLAARTYTTSVGQRDSILLADGSRVVLGPDSRLEVSAYLAPTYAQGSRDVTLHGDAVFVVEHNPARPFTVRVDGAVIEDIGTTFAIESDVGAATRVSVLAGSVRLRAGSPRTAADTGVTLAAGDRGTVDLTGRARAERRAPVADDAAWTSGRLAFRDAPMAQITGELHRWYGVLLNVADSSLADRHVTTTFESDEPVDDVLTKIGLALGARVERHGNLATLTLKRGSVPIR
ncbi:MAG TPA: FecR domain-containing protein [Gemmatimonadaceae bacterium]|nr:FecR domain-containing protein [Gemmatimonadaceae bacterium]